MKKGLRDLRPRSGLPCGAGKAATVGVISNGKEGTKGFFAAFEQVMKDRYGVGEVVLRTKSNYSAPAEAGLLEEAKSWDALVAGIGD